MDNLQCFLSKREQTRSDQSDQFLSDFAIQVCYKGYDPYNNIGICCGISPGRTLQRHHDRWLESAA